MVLIIEIYNEFLSGWVSFIVICDFVKLIYECDQCLGYFLLIGDGLFDCCDIYGFGVNYVFVYQCD